jgi:hypothetical protein
MLTESPESSDSLHDLDDRMTNNFMNDCQAERACRFSDPSLYSESHATPPSSVFASVSLP